LLFKGENSRILKLFRIPIVDKSCAVNIVGTVHIRFTVQA
jgi:hypothetical protein